MGAELVSIHRQTEEVGGMKAKLRMAMLTLVPSAEAPGEPDSPELVAKFENALAEIKKEFN